MPENLVHVCDDSNGPSVWKYCPEEGRSYRFNMRGDLIARINGVSLPDPMTLWEKRCVDREITASSPEGKALRPQRATFDLWGHWQENKP